MKNVSKYIPNSVTRAVARESLRLQKNSPHILFGAGVVGVVAGTVLACRATLKLQETKEENRNDLEEAKAQGEDSPEYRRDVALAYAHGTIRVVRLYALPAAVTTASILALSASHKQLSQRNAALTVAYTGLHNAFEAYRERIREELGAEKEADLYFGARQEAIEIDGTKTKNTLIDPTDLSLYTRCFDETNPRWTKDPAQNRLTLQIQQNYFNQLLAMRGWVFLNEVYEALGFEHTPEGQLVGWIISEDPKHDNYIDFRMYDSKNARFINGTEHSIWLDFNVDGTIFDKIG